MGYLTVTRREGEQIRLTIDPGVDTEKLLRHLLRDGITITLGAISEHKVRVAIDAPMEVLILRDELIN
jgi:sRNA-binding carbon storage regulator CsrA